MGRKALLLVCGAIMILLWAAQCNSYLNVADDSGRYMVLGESLARTGDLRLLNEPKAPLDTLYPPGFPAIIAAWILLTGRDPYRVVLFVKFTQLVLLLCTLPLMLRLLSLARLSERTLQVALLLYACCPALIAYANEVMSEMPLLLLCLASVALVEQSAPAAQRAQGEQQPETVQTPEPGIQVGNRLAALAFAGSAFLVRSSAIALVPVQIVWFFWRFGWRWGAIAALTLALVMGGWLLRNRHITHSHTERHYATYVDQFTLRDPSRMDAGRIPLTPLGILSRMKGGFPVYLGMIPRAPLYMMAPPNTVLRGLFFLVAVPLTLLILYGLILAWRRGLRLCVSFAACFWFVAAMWPWQNARFLVPLIPFMVMFAALAADELGRRIVQRGLTPLQPVLCGSGLALLLIYFATVHLRVIGQERKPTRPGYPLGRSKEEAGFYAACAWLRANVSPETIVMGKPPYLLHLYSGCKTQQIEPTKNPRVQEKAYILPRHIAFLVEDSWSFGFTTHRLLTPYLQAYGDRWTLVWHDPLGSGVRIWKRNP